MEAAQIIALILQGSTVVSTLAPITIATAVALKAIFSKSGTDYTVEIKAFQDGALLAADETDAIIDAWKKEHPEYQ